MIQKCGCEIKYRTVQGSEPILDKIYYCRMHASAQDLFNAVEACIKILNRLPPNPMHAYEKETALYLARLAIERAIQKEEETS
jgi:hypothetical protein